MIRAAISTVKEETAVKQELEVQQDLEVKMDRESVLGTSRGQRRRARTSPDEDTDSRVHRHPRRMQPASAWTEGDRISYDFDHNGCMTPFVGIIHKVHAEARRCDCIFDDGFTHCVSMNKLTRAVETEAKLEL